MVKTPGSTAIYLWTSSTMNMDWNRGEKACRNILKYSKFDAWAFSQRQKKRSRKHMTKKGQKRNRREKKNMRGDRSDCVTCIMQRCIKNQVAQHAWRNTLSRILQQPIGKAATNLVILYSPKNNMIHAVVTGPINIFLCMCAYGVRYHWWDFLFVLFCFWYHIGCYPRLSCPGIETARKAGESGEYELAPWVS